MKNLRKHSKPCSLGHWEPNALVYDGARAGGAELAANLKAGTIYIFERAKSQRRSRERQCIPIRYVGMNGHKYMFEKVRIHEAQELSACNEGKIFLSKSALEYLAYGSLAVSRSTHQYH